MDSLKNATSLRGAVEETGRLVVARESGDAHEVMSGHTRQGQPAGVGGMNPPANSPLIAQLQRVPTTSTLPHRGEGCGDTLVKDICLLERGLIRV
jgi:hypothetical protein